VKKRDNPRPPQVRIVHAGYNARAEIYLTNTTQEITGESLDRQREIFVCPPEGGFGSSWLKHAL
jgi:hypothetical protein